MFMKLSYSLRREQNKKLIKKSYVFITVGKSVKLMVHLQELIKCKLLRPNPLSEYWLGKSEFT